MAALAFGLVAAVCWGIHDICVRYVTQRGGILPALTMVLIIGTLVMAPPALLAGDWAMMGLRSYALSAAAGAAFTIAYVGLYKAFEIGPVRLVAPIIGTYPVLSVGWAALSGRPVSWDQWLALAAVIGGVAIVALLTSQRDTGGSKRAAILWSILGGAAFAATFAMGQAAATAGSEVPAIFVARIAAVALAICLLATSDGRRPPARRALPLLALMGVLDCIALAIVIAAADMARPEFASVAASTFGLITVILAWAFLRERMTIGQWAGVLLTFASIGYLAL
jgi:drug/metabolite transporter (DMT)-like permease